jgi:hypothetical protein
MRGDDVQQEARFSYLSPEARVPPDHPLRPIRNMVNQALTELSGKFQAMYSREGRPSIAPEKLLRLRPRGSPAADLPPLPGSGGPSFNPVFQDDLGP